MKLGLGLYRHMLTRENFGRTPRADGRGLSRIPDMTYLQRN